MNIIEACGLGKRYGRAWALRDCSLAVPAGHVGALVGPNGAGKTTLLHMAVGLAAPSAGQIRVLGDERPGSPPALAGIGFVAQDAPLYRHLSVADTLHLARCLNRTWDQQRAVARMADLGIAPGRSVGSLSGGQQAQLALTIALAKHPQLLILDEPMARLDPLARHDFLGVLMAAVAEDGLSVIFSSHVVAELERVADYLIVLAAGRVQMAGEVAALLAGHQILAGPAADMHDYPARFAPVHVTAAGMQAHLLVRTSGAATAVPPGFEAHPVGLEELVLGYLREPGASALPGPVPALDGRSR